MIFAEEAIFYLLWLMKATAEAPNSATQLVFFNLPEVKSLSHNEKVNAIKKANFERRNSMIKTRFDHLYNVERKRFDDVISQLCDEFSLAKSTIETALKS